MPICNIMIKHGCKYCIENNFRESVRCICDSAMADYIRIPKKDDKKEIQTQIQDLDQKNTYGGNNPANLPTDRLEAMFKLQEVFQKRLGITPTEQYYKEQYCTALIVEAVEALESTPWKHWKTNAKLDIENYKLEIVDIFHFAINLAMSAGMSYEELYQRFKAKNMENHERQNRGY